MSTYCSRFYEVKTSIIDGYASNEKELDDVLSKVENPHDGYTVKLWTYGEYPYMMWNEKKQEWEKKKKCNKRWVLARWYTDPSNGYHPSLFDAKIGYVNIEKKSEDGHFPLCKEGDKLEEVIEYCDNGGIIRDEYISSRNWGDTGVNFDERGFPDDMSDELKKVFSKENSLEYCWDMTYVTVAEWENAFKIRFEKFRNELTKRMMDNDFKKVNEKLDLIMKKVADPSFEYPKNRKKKKGEEEPDGVYYEDSVKYMWEEEFWNLIAIRREIARAYDLTEMFGWNPEEDIRIIYYLS